MKINKSNKYNLEIQQRVYQVNDYIKIMQDVIEDIFSQTHNMSDKDLEYDRAKFMKVVRLTDLHKRDSKGFIDYDADIHTLAIMTTQLLKYGEILYNEMDEVYER